MIREWKALKGGGLALLDAFGDAVDSLTLDPETQQYRNAAGILLGRKWEDARDACIERAGKERKVGRRG